MTSSEKTPSVAHPVPSDWARETVTAGYDLHVHAGPDLMERSVSDLELASRFTALGLGGFVLKSHHNPTAERAAVVRAATGADVLGAVALNRGVGGINPMAVEIAARSGARVVWFPTIDAPAPALSVDPAAGRPPAWVSYRHLLADRGVTMPDVTVVANGAVTQDARTVLDIIAQHGLVLCTGHLMRDDTMAVVKAAREQGVCDIVITHPDSPAQRITVDDQIALAGQGCWIERCFGTPHAGRVAWDDVIDAIRRVGAASTVISSDLGQVGNPPVENGLALMADRLHAAGVPSEDIIRMTVTNTRRLLARSG